MDGTLVGFDLTLLPLLFQSYAVPESEWIFVLDKVRLVTTLALEHWRKNEKDRREQEKRTKKVKAK